MAIIFETTSENGTCPKCGHPHTLDDLSADARGHIEDGHLYTVCRNCREELTLTVTLTHREQA